jgi:hypothetical protein
LTPQGPKVEEAEQHILANASLSSRFCNKDTAEESIPVKDEYDSIVEEHPKCGSNDVSLPTGMGDA